MIGVVQRCTPVFQRQAGRCPVGDAGSEGGRKGSGVCLLWGTYLLAGELHRTHHVPASLSERPVEAQGGGGFRM